MKQAATDTVENTTAQKATSFSELFRAAASSPGGVSNRL
jgi:hypothetical protein